LTTAAKLLLKAAFLAVAVWLISRKLELSALADQLAAARPAGLLAAAALFNASQVLSAVRLQVLLAPIASRPTWGEQWRLYYAGMFYNLYLPAGIGGDALKAYWLQGRFGTGWGRLITALLLDRGAGFAALLALAAAAAGVWTGNGLWLAAAAVPLAGFAAGVAWLTPRFRTTRSRALGLSLGIQALQGAAAGALMLALGLEGMLYLLLFFVSGVAALLPITLGGAGARELVFLYALPWAGLPASGGVAMALLFFAITAVSSLVGWVWAGTFLRPDANKAGAAAP